MTMVFFSFQTLPRRRLRNIFLEPITQILGVPEGDVAGEIFINMGSTINITCIVRNLPEKSSMYWTHNNEVRVHFEFYGFGEPRRNIWFQSKSFAWLPVVEGWKFITPQHEPSVGFNCRFPRFINSRLLKALHPPHRQVLQLCDEICEKNSPTRVLLHTSK